MREFIALLLALGIGGPACFAGSGPDQKHVEKIKKQVSKSLENGRAVSVETYDQHKMSGAIVEADPDTFVLTVAGRPTSILYTNVKMIKAPMDPHTRHQIIVLLATVGFFAFLLVELSHDR
jgi:hypothetical protein